MLVYLDDILVYSQTEAEHLGHLRVVFETLHRLLTKKSHFCDFCKREVGFLATFVPTGMQVDPSWVGKRNIGGADGVAPCALPFGLASLANYQPVHTGVSSTCSTTAPFDPPHRL